VGGGSQPLVPKPISAPTRLSENRRRTPLADLYWENSELNQTTIRSFSRRIEEHSARATRLPPLEFAGPDLPLPLPRDGLFRRMASRSSGRSFHDRPLDARELGSLFAAFARHANGARTFPSAGSTYAIEVYALLFNVRGDLRAAIVHYNPDNHSLSRVGAAPSWSECAERVNLEVVGEPAALFLFVIIPERTTDKYGERGLRFTLLEAGHAAQNLSLRLVEENLVGCEAGGVFDRWFKTVLGLDETSAQIALGFACGHPARRA
jgi:SagB-type dehydrogenase family enzyme